MARMTPAEREALLNQRIYEAATQVEGFTKRQTKFALDEIQRVKAEFTEQLAKATGDDGKVKRERLNSLLNDIKRTERNIARSLEGSMNTSINATLNRAFEDLNEAFLEAGLGRTGISFNRLNEYALKYTVQRYGDDGLILSDRVWRFAEGQSEQLNTIVRNGIIQGQAVNEIIRNITTAGIASGYAVERLVRTEVTTAYRTAFAYTAQQSKLVNYVQIVRGVADRPEHKCTIYSLEDPYGKGDGIFKPTDSKIYNPHPNCTSYLLYVLEPENVEDAVQRQESIDETAPEADATKDEATERLSELAQMTSRKDIERWAKQNLASRHIDLKDFDVELARDSIAQIYTLQQRFPEAMAQFQGYGTAQGFYSKWHEHKVEQMFRHNIARTKPDGSPMFPNESDLRDAIRKKIPKERVASNINAFATRYGVPFDGVYVNRNLAKDYAEFKRRKAEAVAVKWSTVGTPTGTISHEYGHMLDYWLQANHPDARKRIIDEVYDVVKQQDVRWWGENISRYGRTNDREFFAETFADYIHHGENAKPMSQEIGRRLESEFARIRKGT